MIDHRWGARNRNVETQSLRVVYGILPGHPLDQVSSIVLRSGAIWDTTLCGSPVQLRSALML